MLTREKLVDLFQELKDERFATGSGRASPGS